MFCILFVNNQRKPTTVTEYLSILILDVLRR